MGTVTRLIAAHAERVKVATGFGPLDDVTRGGPHLGARIVIGGAPNAGKTTLACQLGLGLAARGVAVIVLATDEGAGLIAVRVAQQGPGLPRASVEAGEGLDKLAAYLDALPGSFDIVADMPIEQAAERLPSEGPCALIVDSLQTAKSATHAGNGKKAATEGALAALEALCKDETRPVLVIATSELARDAYKGGKRSKSALGSYKNSGDIEYDVDVALSLVPNDAQGRTVSCTVDKNRLGERGAVWTLARDAVRARYSSAAPQTPEERPRNAKAPVGRASVESAPAPASAPASSPPQVNAGTLIALAFFLAILAGAAKTCIAP